MIALFSSPAFSKVLLSSVSGFGGYAVIKTPPDEPPAWLRIYLPMHAIFYECQSDVAQMVSCRKQTGRVAGHLCTSPMVWLWLKRPVQESTQ